MSEINSARYGKVSSHRLKKMMAAKNAKEATSLRGWHRFLQVCRIRTKGLEKKEQVLKKMYDELHSSSTGHLAPKGVFHKVVEKFSIFNNMRMLINNIDLSVSNQPLNFKVLVEPSTVGLTTEIKFKIDDFEVASFFANSFELKLVRTFINEEGFINDNTTEAVILGLQLRLQEQAAIKVQANFRGYKSRNTDEIPASQKKPIVSFEEKRIILEHMTELNRLVHASQTAQLVNFESVMGKLSPNTEFFLIRDGLISRMGNFTLQGFYFFNSIIAEPTRYATTNNLKWLLATEFHNKIMNCNEIHMKAIIDLRNNPALKNIEDKIYVCQVGGHIILTIGHPSDPNSLVADYWLKYVNFKAHSKYRPQVSPASERERGFLGTVAQYKDFLRAHPNRYVKYAIASCEIKVHKVFTERTKGISPYDFEEASSIPKALDIPRN